MRPTETEKILNDLFTSQYGTDLSVRNDKLREEYTEYITSTSKDNAIDELSDLVAVATHIAGIYGVTIEELQLMAIDKVRGRINNPNYKR